MNKSILLNIHDLNAFFGEKQVLYNVSLQLKKGQKLAIVGESGSGKTVLAQAIMRLNPDVRLSGSINIQGQEVLNLSAKQLQKMRGKNIGMVFQEPMTALNPIQKIGSQIAEVLIWHKGLSKKEAWHQAGILLEKTGIEDAFQKLHAYSFQLSGGQRQRVMIAIAIAAKPELLIADEPTTALDVMVEAQILDLLKNLQQETAMSLLYISHNLRVVRQFADWVVVMKGGHIVESGSVDAIFNQPQHEYTRTLLHAFPEPLARITHKNEIILAAKNLFFSVEQKTSWRHKKQKILLDHISFKLEKGKTLGVIGESGSGKSTLAKALLRLINSSGSLNIEGVDWYELKPRTLRPYRQAMQIVFQDPFSALNPRMTIADIIGEPLTVYEPTLSRQVRIHRVAEVLKYVELDEDIMFNYPHEFSGGQRQRIAIARALISRPKILVLDEPTSALDMYLQNQLLLLLRKLQQQFHLSMIFISHDLSVIRSVAHHVLIIKNGQLVESGDIDTIFDHPNSTYTKNLLQLSFS